MFFSLDMSSDIKIKRPIIRQFYLSILAGVCIALGCAGLAFIKSDSPLPTALSGILSGFIFSFGLFAIFSLGLELFTGNNLMFSSYIRNKITFSQMLKVWGITFAGNTVGCLLISVIFSITNLSYVDVLRALANSKVDLPLENLFARGILCNILICLAVLISQRENGIVQKFFASSIPVIVFVACGYEHSIADIFILSFSSLNIISVITCLSMVLFGNIVGGIIVSALYTYSYER